MAGLEKLIVFNLALQAPVLPGVNFDTAAILSFSPRESSWSTSEKTRLYTTDDLGGDFASGTPERIYAARYLAQTEAGRPRSLMVMRGSDAPSQVIDVGVVAAISGKDYIFMAEGIDDDGEPFSEEVAFTATTNVVADVIAGLVAAFPTISGVTAASAATNTLCRVTGVAGTWLALSLKSSAGVITGPYNPENNLLTISSTAAEPSTEVADQMDAIVAERKGFYGILNPYEGCNFALALANWVEGHERLLLQQDSSTAGITSVLSGAQDFMAQGQGLTLLRTAGIHHNLPKQAVAAGWMGCRLPAFPGTADWVMSEPTGVTPTYLTPTHDANLAERSGNSFGFIGADGNTWPGDTLGGVPIDYIILRDKVKATTEEAIYNLHKSMGRRGKKVPSGTAGLLMGRGAVKDALEQLTKEPNRALESFDISFPRQVDRSAEDISTRNVSGVVITAKATSSIRTYHDVTGILTQ